MNANLLIQQLGPQSLDQFVAELSAQFGLSPFEERQSTNYLDERYFRCLTLGLEVTVALADEVGFDAYQFWISLQPEVTGLEDQSFLDGLADCFARKLALHGHVVARPLDFTRLDRGTVYYRPNPRHNGEPRARVLVEEA